MKVVMDGNLVLDRPDWADVDLEVTSKGVATVTAKVVRAGPGTSAEKPAAAVAPVAPVAPAQKA